MVKARPAIKFMLVGDGPWRARFEEMTRAYGLKENVVFAGLVPPEKVPALTGIMDILVHLSRREGLARAIPQAAASGKPVVAYDCDGASEGCVQGETGYLVSPGDLLSLKRHLVNLASDPALRSTMGQRGRVLAQSRFAVETMVERLHALYSDLYAGCHRGPGS